MPTQPKKTKDNPHGLTYNQDLVIKDITEKVKRGENLTILESTEKFYDTKNRKSAHQVVAYNMRNTNFREALVSSLVDKSILGADSKTEDRLLEGLDAEKKGEVDYDARLKYIQEINKIAGVYAAEKKAILNLNIDVTEEELDEKIASLREQLM